MNSEAVSLIIGADGLLGQALAQQLRGSGERVIETTRRRETLSEHRIWLDLREDLTEWHPPGRVSVAYLCAAVSSLEACRREPLRSARVNVQNSVTVAKTLVAAGAFVIFLSTNLVFDGALPFRPADTPPCPQTEYGRQKADAERQLFTLGPSVAVARFTKIMAPNMPLFSGWIQALQQHTIIHPFSDMWIAPVPLPFASGLLIRIAKARLSGLIQISGDEDISYAQIGAYLAQRLEAPPHLVQPVQSTEAGLNFEATPAHTTLDTTRLRTELGVNPPPVWETITSGCL
jgi:dTDP-4-dehydrorhamnose reductase